VLSQVTAVRASEDGGSVWCVSYSDAETFIEGELSVDQQGQVGSMAGVVRQLKMGDGGFWEVREGERIRVGIWSPSHLRFAR